ncbi:hypothetical protein N5D45_16195 [Stenotrophomonas sp. GD03819]|uniref:hypothetical protein n=1 Tax=Stenotrophomonas sp. GD03819 TaxID=2975384 RepID=UPI00244C26F0|nr:hypothetical protein [Stenotrophomonas sp. GD03819]MDH1793357.1 hypothetical protein [Stenotrophomonas sp. GD03819]MDJ1523975.1 hypothetical protein [Stenotrophomonas maltophilia]
MRLAGIHSLGFAAFHLAFWRLFGWKRELAQLGMANRAIMQILNLRVIYVFLGMGLIFAPDLVDTRLGVVLLGFMAVFWVGRTLEQFVFLRINDWRVHLLTGLFVLGAALHAVPMWLGFMRAISR